MINSNMRIRFSMTLCAALFLAQCSLVHREVVFSSGALKPEKLAGEIVLLEKTAIGDPDPSERAAAHLRLARIFFSSGNPQPDYRRAREELEAYLALRPERRSSEEIGSWLAVLTELGMLDTENRELKSEIGRLTRKGKELEAAAEKLNNENRQSAKENRELKGAVEKLSRENEGLRAAVETLKALDVEMEEKRRQIK